MHLVNGIPEDGLLCGQTIPEAAFFRDRGLTFHRQGDALFDEGFIDQAKRAFRSGEPYIRRALIQSLLDFHGAEPDAERRFSLNLHLFERPTRGKRDQRDEHSLVVVQRSPFDDFAIDKAFLHGNEIGIGPCQQGLIITEKLLSVLFRQPDSVHNFHSVVSFRFRRRYRRRIRCQRKRHQRHKQEGHQTHSPETLHQDLLVYMTGACNTGTW